MALAIEASGLSRIYRESRKHAAVRAVDKVDLQVEQGEVVALLGPNGAGKTTMVRLLACLLRPNEGAARVAGHDIRREPQQVRAACGLSTEAPGLYERLTATQYLAFFARLYSVPEGEIEPRIRSELEAAGLWERRDDRLATYSKGMRQKINLARAVLHRPRVVFLDEPTSGLDVEAAGQMREQIRATHQSQETTFLICTHNLPEAERLCTRIAVINQGHIMATGSPEELKLRLLGQRTLLVRLRQVRPEFEQSAASVPGVASVERNESGLLLRLSRAHEETSPLLARRLVEAGAEILSLTLERQGLEEVYLRLVRQENQREEVTQ